MKYIDIILVLMTLAVANLYDGMVYRLGYAARMRGQIVIVVRLIDKAKAETVLPVPPSPPRRDIRRSQSISMFMRVRSLVQEYSFW